MTAYVTPHGVWAAVLRTQGPKGKAVIKAYREELWVRRQTATAPARTMLQEQMLRRTKRDLVKAARGRQKAA
ncbi:hypothetical protein ACFV3E_06020 [Streptomyces sp. NPDC059718]